MPSEEYYHSDVKEIMITKPNWILKWGNMIIMGMLLVLVAFAAFFTYPESITTDITLTAVQAVETVKPKPINWGLQAVLVKNGVPVTPGTPLVAWRDAANADYNEVLRLEKLLLDYAAKPRKLAADVPNQSLLRRFFKVDSLKLGSLRPAFRYLNQQLATQHALPDSSITRGLRQVAAWKKSYVSVAQTSGRVQVNYSIPQTATPLASSKTILYVQPATEEFVAQGFITSEQYPMVKAGQQVLMVLAELGNTQVAGQVLGVAPIAEHNRHQVFIRLDAVQPAPINASFSGNARIVLHKRPLLEKFLASKS